MSSRRYLPVVILVFLCCCHAVAYSQVQVQVQNFPFKNVIPNQTDTDDLQKPANLFSDRKLVQALNKAQERLQKEDYKTGLQMLQGLLEQPDDLFLPDISPPVGLKATVEQALVDLPPVGREAYERLYGPVANAMLQQALADQDMHAIREVSRLYLHTEAGFQACYELGIYYFNHAQPRAALRAFERLKSQKQSTRTLEPGLSLTMALCWVKIGSSKQAVETLQDLHKMFPAGKGNADQSGTAAVKPLMLDWLLGEVGATSNNEADLELSRWLQPRGNRGNNGSGSAINPLGNPIWSVSLSSSLPPEGFQLLDADSARESVENQLEIDVPDFPVGIPLVLEDIVIVRTLSNLRAIDRQTGAIRWETYLHDQDYQSLLAMGLQDEPDLGPANGPKQIAGKSHSTYQQYVLKRLLHDAASSQISSDGKNVYALHSADMEVPVQQQQLNAGFFRRNGTTGNQNQNMLIASEIEADGRLKWTLGGSEENPDEPLSGVTFLGAPLPLNGKLYCLGDDDGELRLIAVDAETGKPDWTQGLVLSQIGASMLGENSMSGLTPAYQDGILVCPTSAGMVIAFDLAQRQLLWAREYTSNIPSFPSGNPMRVMIQINGQVLQQQAHQRGWQDTAPVIVNGKVLLTPKDSNELLCIDLLSGSLLWRRPRGNAVYLACVYDDKVIVVERSQIAAWNLADGTPAWAKKTPIAKPSGRGCRSGTLYHVPLINGEIATLDLNSGQILVSTRLPDGDRAGNLIALGGTLFVQGVGTVYAFQTIGELQPDLVARLQQDPSQHTLRTNLALLHLHNGDLNAGLEGLRRASQAGDQRASQLLTDSLLEGLRVDFAAYRDRAEEVANLLNNDEQRNLYNRLFAVGLEDTGEYQLAFRHYLRMIDTEGSSLIRYTGDHQARKDRWVNSHLSSLFQQAGQADRSEMNALLQQRFASLAEEKKISTLRNMLNSYAGFPIASQIKRLLLQRLDRDKDALEVELLISSMMQSDQSAERMYATAQMAQLYLDHGVFAASKPLLRRLENEWASEKVVEDKTGLQLISDWRGKEAYKQAFEQADSIWPDLPINIKKDSSPSARSASRERKYPIYFQGVPGPNWDNWRLYLDQNRRNLIAEDPNGIEAWQVQLATIGQSSANSSGNYALANGHLLVIAMTNRFIVLDTFPRRDTKVPKLLWKRDFNANSQAGNTQTVIINGQAIQLGRANRLLSNYAPRSIFGKVGALQNNYIAYIVGSTLYAAHPLTGDILWSREDVAAGSNITGNAQNVYVSDLTGNQVTIFNAADGSIVATRHVPGVTRQITLLDGQVLYWQKEGNEKTFICKDILSQNVVWQKSCHQDVNHVLVQNEELALLQRDGQFDLYDIRSGKHLIEQKLNMFDDELQSFFVVRSQRQYFILPSHKQKNAINNRFGRSMMPNSVLVHGNVYALDRETGRMNWSNQVQDQSFPYTQVYETPLLVFANRTYRRVNGRAQNEYHITILDSRNGKIIEESQGSQAINYYGMTTDPENKTIAINLQQYQLIARFEPELDEE